MFQNYHSLASYQRVKVKSFLSVGTFEFKMSQNLFLVKLINHISETQWIYSLSIVYFSLFDPFCRTFPLKYCNALHVYFSLKRKYLFYTELTI